ncbi:uncharacterized protein LOC120007301 [Tripterygium wilfordii]|uniref:uncharacterized protein LOC120007301 n=1 Tax=Tripterygium wilfordii TaxID=458696 RepID=UPI0018F84AD0|nr:uncharacterized protein LOC120007301 [Tripterygium wilfordii]
MAKKIDALTMNQAQERKGTLPSQLEMNPKGKEKEQCMVITLRTGKVEKTVADLDAKKAKILQEKKKCIKIGEKQLDWPDSSFSAPLVKPYVPPIPFPQRLKSAKKNEDQFSKFLEAFKKIHVNIPFAKALEQIPSYAKFLKEILPKKQRLKEHEKIQLTEERSVIVQRKLPIKQNDPKISQSCAL